MVKYIIRLDDACATHDTIKWMEIEKILDEFSIKPIVGVIPKNQDEQLKYSKKNQNLWDLIKKWQSKEWVIALHGYNHKCFKIKRGNRQFLPLNDVTEFVGLKNNEQKKKLQKSIDIFRKNGVSPNVFMAPCHSFDIETLNSLRAVSNINFISDGFSFRPYLRYGFKWIPQQLWKFKLMPFGIWTICLHPSSMSNDNFKSLYKILSIHSKKFVNPNKIISKYKFSKYNLFDFIFSCVYRLLLFFKKSVKK